MREYLRTHLAIALHACVVAFVIFCAAWYVSYAQSKTEDLLTKRIDGTRAHIAELATLTDRNDADALTGQIIGDCSRRAEFETLLNGLNVATKRELISAQQLFESCGAFFAERKALMVAQLEREYRSLSQDLELLSVLRDLKPSETVHREWEKLIILERERSAFLREQTDIQAEIIKLLIEGGNSARIQELVRQAQDVNQSLTVTDAQIDVLRNALTS